ncbi:hypothetical protein ABK040_001836 [Willaertia magna]
MKEGEAEKVLCEAGLSVSDILEFREGVLMGNLSMVRRIVWKVEYAEQRLGLNNSELLNVLLNDLEFHSVEGLTSVYVLTYKECIPLLKYILRKGALVNIKTFFENTPLFRCAVLNKKESARILLKFGAIDIPCEEIDCSKAITAKERSEKEDYLELTNIIKEFDYDLFKLSKKNKLNFKNNLSRQILVDCDIILP